jgi:hypothetical protein
LGQLERGEGLERSQEKKRLDNIPRPYSMKRRCITGNEITKHEMILLTGHSAELGKTHRTRCIRAFASKRGLWTFIHSECCTRSLQGVQYNGTGQRDLSLEFRASLAMVS